jgi:hypothetical protein
MSTFVLLSAAYYDTKRELVGKTMATFMAYEGDENDCSMMSESLGSVSKASDF